MKVGILFGPASGNGRKAGVEVLLAEKLKDYSVAICHGIFGTDKQPYRWFKLVPHSREGYVANLYSSVEAIASWGAELLVCVGGDGLASYAADAMLAIGQPMLLLGIGAGTINVGPIITMRLDELLAFDFKHIEKRRVSGVEVLVDGRHLAYGFNDIVIGNTFLGTLEGKAVNLSANALLLNEEKKIEEPSSDITTESFRICKNGIALDCSIKKPAQIIISPLRPHEFYGRAVSGVLCSAAFLGESAALALFDQVIIKSEMPLHGFRDFAHSDQLIFSPQEIIQIEGLSPNGQIIVDGNPFARNGDVLQFKVFPNLVDVAIPKNLEGCT